MPLPGKHKKFVKMMLTVFFFCFSLDERRWARLFIQISSDT